MVAKQSLAARIARLFAPRSSRGRQARFDRLEHEGRILYAEGKFDLFRSKVEEAVAVAKEAGRTEEYGRSCDRLGELMEAVGMYSHALPLMEEALKVREELYGKDDYRIASGLNNLALLNYVRGAFEQAEKEFLRLKALLERTAPQSQELLTCIDNYAAVLRKQKRDSEAAEVALVARKLKEEIKALTIREEKI